MRFETQLSIDFGEVGYHDDKQPFSILLDAKDLTLLIDDARQARGIYELLLIDRPGDVWRYVRVRPLQLTDRARGRIEYFIQTNDRNASGRKDLSLSFIEFDRLFTPDPDGDPEGEAWERVRSAPTLSSFAAQLLAMVRGAVSRLGWNDALITHVVATIRNGTHPYHLLPREQIHFSTEGDPINPPLHTAQFYDKLRRLLQDPDIASVAYRGEGDYRVQRLLATEQRRRADATGHRPGIALHMSALVNREIHNDAWDWDMCYFMEGLAHGDLRIEEGNSMGASMLDLVVKHGRIPGRFILSNQDEGEIPGFSATSGEGWHLYTRDTPETRRAGLDRIHHRRYPLLQRVLQFSAHADCVFSYEKAVILVGSAVNDAVRVVLARMVVNWQRGGDVPLVLVEGDPSVFEGAGCRIVETVGSTGDDANKVELQDLLQRLRPWIDIVIAIDPAPWITQQLQGVLERGDRVWPAWVVATNGTQHLAVDTELTGDVAAKLERAVQRAANRN